MKVLGQFFRLDLNLSLLFKKVFKCLSSINERNKQKFKEFNVNNIGNADFHLSTY